MMNKRLYLSVGILALLLGITISNVAAHGSIWKTSPEDGSELSTSPDVVQVWFDEPLVPGTGKITVIDSNGKRVDLEDTRFASSDFRQLEVHLQPNLPKGTYIISAAGIVSTDGHEATGGALFWVGAKTIGNDTETQPVYSLVAFFMGMLMLGGLASYFLLKNDPLDMTPPDQNMIHFPLE